MVENDSSYIYNFPHRITFKTYFSTTDFRYTIRDYNAKYKPLEYRPNTNGSIGISGSYKNLGAYYSFRIKESPDVETKKGQSECSDFRLVYFYQKYGFDGYIENYKGLYLTNPRFFYNLPDIYNYPQLHNMKLTTIGYNFIYTHNDNFSFRSMYFQSVRQKKSAGSLVFIYSNRFFRYINDSTIVPQKAREYMPEFTSSNKGTIWDMSVAPGYAYTVVKGLWFASGSLFTGFGEQMQIYTKNDLIYSRYKLNAAFNIKAAIGYNGDNYFAKISYDMDIHTMRIEDSRQNTMLNEFDFVVGIRIK